MWYVAFYSCLLPLSICHEVHSHCLHVSVAHSFLLLSFILLTGCTVVQLSSHWSVEMWVVSSLVIMSRATVNRHSQVFVWTFSFMLGKKDKCMFSFLRNCSIILQSGSFILHSY